MKKWFGTICSAAASVLTFVFMAIPFWKLDVGGLGKETYNGYQLISEAKNADLGAMDRYKVFAIILIVLAALLAVMAVVMLLSNLSILKVDSKLLSTINCVLLTLTAVVAVVCLTQVLAIVGDFADELDMTAKQFKKEVKAVHGSIGTQFGAWAVAGINVIACALGWTLGRESK